MNASTSAPGSSGARRQATRNSRPAFSSCLTFPRCMSAGASQRGRRPDPAEQHVHRAVPQQVHVIDRVRARGHPGDQARDLQMRVHAAFAAWPDGSATRPASGTVREGHHRDQPGVRHEIRVVERCVRLRQAMQQSHLTGSSRTRRRKRETLIVASHGFDS